MAGAIWLSRIIGAAALLAAGSNALAADGGVWSVSKSSGEVWVTSRGVEQASLQQEEVLKPGDAIRTGRNGRVLLVRGEETILIAPNSVIALPVAKKDGMSTTILQQAGSILLDVEKRKVKHFEVETPYLAAVVKGTHFRVTVNAASTSVEVSRGQVEVSDFRSGQIAQVMPGQVATSYMHGGAGLFLSGSGTFKPIEQGRPRASSLDRIPVPKGGLSAPRNAANGQVIHALRPMNASALKSAAAPLSEHTAASHVVPPKAGVVRISASLGEVRLNVQKVTHGFAHGGAIPGVAKGSQVRESATTIWSEAKSGGSETSAAGRSASSNGNGSAATAADASPMAGVAATVAATAAAANSNNGKGNGNGATGNGEGNSQGAGNGGNDNANGNGNGNGNGNSSGNGNGNSGAHGRGH